MIRKSNKELLNWIYKYVIDFTDESNSSELTWESTHDEALKFMHSLPQKERVQKYGFFSSRTHFFLVDSFDEITEVLLKGFISEDTCKLIYKWNSEIERENWDMNDVKKLLYPDVEPDSGINRKYVFNMFYQLQRQNLIECVNPEAEHGKLFRLTEKGEELFGGI